MSDDGTAMRMTGYQDGRDGKSPRFPDNADYMGAYNEGKAVRSINGG